jgi:hypothetical protein
MSPLLQRLLARLQAPEGGDGGGSGGGGTPPPPPAAPRPPEPQTFSSDYVRELREENKGWRLKASEQEALAKKAKEDAEKAITEANGKSESANKAANDRIVRAELKAVALKAGMVDLDGLKLADLSKVKLNAETGEVEGAEELMKALKEAKPYLFGAASTSNTKTPPPKGDGGSSKKATEMTPEEYKAARAAALKG